MTAPSRRAQVKWIRPESPAMGLATALLITFPTNGLTPGETMPDRPIHWIPPAPAGEAVKVGFFYTMQEAEHYAIRNGPPATCMAQARLPNGETVVLFHSYMKFDTATFFARFRQPVRLRPEYLTANRDLPSAERTRLLVWPDPPEVGTHEFVDVGVSMEGLIVS